MKNLRYLFILLLMMVAMSATSSNYSDVYKSTRTDFRDETIYFVMTTRFYDGDPSNNTQCWDNQAANEGDPAWRGDFKGLIEKLDYIKALGFTAVWITPVVENASGYDYHGYHAFNFSKVDKRYESEDVSFQTLIDEAHKRGMKIILDIVLNHTGNFGEENLCKLFTRDWTADQSSINDCMIPYTQKDGGKLPDNYLSLAGGEQHNKRLAQMKNTDGVNHDTNNYWHHVGNSWNWDDYSRWYGQIAGDCVDLNTENPYVTNYLVSCYGKFIAMGVDGFRIDTSGHISRLTFNKAFVPQFLALAEQYKEKRGGGDFFMYGEDIDLSYRILKGGFHNYYLPLPILHYKGESTQKSSYRYVHVFYEAMLIFFQKHFFGFFIAFRCPKTRSHVCQLIFDQFNVRSFIDHLRKFHMIYLLFLFHAQECFVAFYSFINILS